VEAHCHDTIGGIEGLLHAIAVMDVYIYVENTLVVLKQLEDSKDNIVDVAKAGGLRFLGMMQATAPVDADLRGLFVQLYGCSHGSSGGELAKLVESVEYGAIFAHIEALHLLVVLGHVVWPNGSQEPDVLVRVELGHLIGSGFVGTLE